LRIRIRRGAVAPALATFLLAGACAATERPAAGAGSGQPAVGASSQRPAAEASSQRPPVVASSQRAAVGAGPTLQNPGFDASAPGPGAPSGWATQGAQHGTARVVEREGARGGQALELAAGPGDSTGNASFMVYQALDPAAFRGQEVEFGARIASQGAGLNLTLWSPEGHANDLFSDPDQAAWVERRQSFRVPEDASALNFALQLLGAAGGKVWVDEVFLRPAGAGGASGGDAAGAGAAAATGAAAGGAAAAGSGGPAARFRIEAGQPARRLPDDFFAMHIEWVEDGQGLVKAGTGRIRDDVVALLQPLEIPMLRFPGGIPADFYDWRKGVGPASERGEIRNPFNGKQETVHFGSPEFIALARRLDADACITANYGTGSAADAGAWAAWFAEQGFAPRCWEVGNEIYLSGPEATGPNSKAIYAPGAKYARDWPGYAAAIKQAIPGAEVGAIAHLDTGAFPLADGGNRDWTVRMLDALEARVDFFALHNGYAPVVIDDSVDLGSPEERRRLYRAMFAGAQQTQDNLAAVAREIGRRSPTNASAPFAITEFGTLVGLSGQPARHAAYVDHTRTQASAVYVASVLDVYMGDPRVTLTMYTNPVHKWYGNLVLDDASGLVTSPAYHLYRFYADRFEHGLVETAIETPTYDSPTVGVVKARSAVPVLMGRAGRSADGRRVTALLVNRGLDGPLETELVFRGFAPERISCRVLAAPAPHAINGPGLTDTVKKGSGIAPRDFPCEPAATQKLSLPAASILSVVAEG